LPQQLMQDRYVTSWGAKFSMTKTQGKYRITLSLSLDMERTKNPESHIGSFVTLGEVSELIEIISSLANVRFRNNFSSLLGCLAYWAENGFAKIAMGKNMLGIEDGVAWATPGTFTTLNVPCSEDGQICGGEVHGKRLMFKSQEYIDPSVYLSSQ